MTVTTTSLRPVPQKFILRWVVKWLTYRDALAQGVTESAETQALYLLCWPGMSLKEFAAEAPATERTDLVRCWLAPAVKTLVGAGLVWVAVPAMPADAWLLRGWVGMTGRLFPPVFVRNVMLPMLHAIGATGNAP